MCNSKSLWCWDKSQKYSVNIKFKIITKVIADRLETILPSMIPPGQSGFVNGRKIRDNICMASKAMNLLNHKSVWGNVALKIDISKDFDSLSWHFLLKTLLVFSFSDKLCLWMNVILESTHLSVGMNGKKIGFLKCFSGVRQGDPLSPLLYVWQKKS